MASYDDILEEIRKKRKERESYNNQLNSNDNNQSTSSSKARVMQLVRENETLESTKANYKNSISKLNSEKNKLVDMYKQKGIIVNNGFDVAPSNFITVAENNKKIDVTKKYEKPIIKNQAKAMPLYEEVKKYNENIANFKKISETENFKKQQEAVDYYRNIMGENYMEYMNKKLENDDIGWYDKTLGRLVAGITPFSQFTAPLVKNEEGETYFLPDYESLKHQKVINSYDDSFMGTMGKIGSSALYEGGKLVTSAVLNKLMPGVGTATYFTDMYTNQYNNAMQEGYSSSQATAYATLGTATEAVTGKILGGTTNAIFNTGSSEMSNIIGKGLSKIIKNSRLVNVLSNAISEGGEEFVQEYIDRLNRNLTLGENNKVFSQETFEDAMFSAAVGSLTGGFSNIANTTPQNINQVNNNAINQQLNAKNDMSLFNNDTIDRNERIDLAQINSERTQNQLKKINPMFEINNEKLMDIETKTINNAKKYNNVVLEPVSKMMKLFDGGGSRNFYQFSENINDIKENGVEEPIVISLENDTIADGNHRLFIAYKLGMKNVPVKYINSDIDTKQNKWYPKTIKEWEIYDEKGNRTSQINDRNQNEQIYSNRSIRSGRNGRTNSTNNQLYKTIQEDNFGSSIETRNSLRNSTTEGELNNSSFSLDENSKRYEDLKITNNIEYFKKDNGNIRVTMRDINNNLVNELDIYSKQDSIKQFGENIGNYIYTQASEDFNKIYIGNDINNTVSETDYFMNHRPSETGITADNLINQDVESPMPLDIYEHPEYYSGTDSQALSETMQVLNKVRNNPDAKLTIYRATTGNKINRGDWVTLSKRYAEIHNQSNLNGKGKIISLEVKAKDIQFAGDDLNEFGYFPNDIKIPTSKDINKINMPSVESKSNNDNNNNNNKVSNPIEISQLTPEDANTTPKLQKVNRNKTSDGNSKFADNIENKVNMLTEEQKGKILDSDEVKYYDKVTNKESLEKAFDRLNKNGLSETLNWQNRFTPDENGKMKQNPTSVDVAEGWILMKQYADNGDYDSMVEIAKTMRRIGSIAGQTVQAFNIMERMTPEGMVKYAQSELQEAYDKMVKNKSREWIDKYRADFDLKPDEVQFIMDTMKEVSTMEEGYDKRVKLAEIQKLMTDKLPPAKGSGIKSWMRISMLFNPKTQVRNVAGNAIIMPVNSFGDLFASYADKIISKKTGVRTTGKTNIKAMLKGMKEGAYQATNDYKKGINTKDMSGNRFEITEGKNFNDKTLMGKSLNKVEGMLNYVMDAGDRVFSQAAFENSLQNQMVLNNTTEITQDMLDIARTESLQRTWNDNNSYTKFVLDVRRMMNKINIPGMETYGLGDILIPFAKTPANLTKAIVDYSPLGLVNTIVEGNNLRKSLTNGQFTPQMQHRFVQDLGKATAGTMLYVLGYALAKSGRISGESDDDKDVSNFLKNTLGISSYSIKIGNKSFTYDWAQPIAAPLSIMANVVNSKNNKGQALTEAIVGSLDTAGSILLEQSFLQSINDVLNDNDGVVSGLINEMLELPSRAVPTFSKQIADLVDGTQRTSFEYGKPIQSAVNSMKAKIPFVSKTLAPTVDTMGREVQKYGGKNNIFNVFLNPANVNTENISEGAEEIYKVYKSTGDKSIMPRVPEYKYKDSEGNLLEFNSKDRSQYQKISGNIIENTMKDLLKNSKYTKLSDEDKASVINEIVNYSYNKAREEVLGLTMSSTYKNVNKYVSSGGKVSDYYTKKEEIDYSIKNPDKYNVITNITTYDKYQEYKKNIQNIRNNTKDDKNQTISYINSLSLSIPQKAMFIKQYYSSFDDYNIEIINYINDKDISLKEKENILTELGFTIRDGRVYW